MIGYAVRSRRLWAPEAMTDPFRNNPKGEQRGYAVVAREKVMKEKEVPNSNDTTEGEPPKKVKVESTRVVKFFTREAAKFRQTQAEVRRDPKYVSAFYYYPNQNRQVVPLKTELKGRTANNDVDELIANFISEEYTQSKPAVTERDLGLMTLKEYNMRKANMRRKLLSLYNGENSNLVAKSHFGLVFYDKRSNQIRQYGLRYQQNMRQAINQMANDAVQFAFSRRHFDWEFLLASRKAGPLYCSASEKDFSHPDCRRMIGWAVQRSPLLLEPPVNAPPTCGLLDDRKTAKPILIALVRDKEDKVSRLNFTNDLATSKKQF